jgi:septum formation inhibitor-activating ATPase MinD
MERKGFVLKGTSQSVEMVVGQVTPDVTSVRDADRVIGRYFDIDKAQIQLNVEREEGRQVVETSTSINGLRHL